MQFSSRDLSEQYISQSYQDVVQRYTPNGPISYFLDGLGNVIAFIPTASIGKALLTSDQTASYAQFSLFSDSAITSITSTYADTSSYTDASDVHGTVESSSYALSSSNAVSASYGYSSSYALSASYSPPQDLSALLSSSIFNDWTGSSASQFSGTASYAKSSSIATSASISNTASYLPVGTYNITSSWSNNSLTASYITSSNINGIVNSASYAVTSSYLTPGTYSITSSNSTNSISASYLSGSIGIVNSFTAYNGIDVGGMSSGVASQTVVQLGFGLNRANDILNGIQIGYQAGYGSTKADGVIQIGNDAGYLSTSASNAVQIGNQAGYYSTNAIGATHIGFRSGYNAPTGSFTTFIGTNADALNPNLNVAKSIAIGYNAKASGSNMCVLGGTGIDAVKVGIGTTSPVNTLEVVGNISASSFTGSITSASYGFSASYALSASYAPSSTTSSFTTSASYLNPGATIYLSQSYITSVTGSTQPPYTPATIWWDDNAKTYAIYSDHQNVSLQIGQENWIRAYADEYIPNGSPVYAHSSLNGLPCVRLALATGIYLDTKSEVIGLATENISSGSIGVITSQGQIHDVNTSGFINGQHIFLSNVNSGSLVSDPPLDPYENVNCGYVLTSDAVNGIIQVEITNLGQRIYPFVGITSTPSISILGSTVTVGSSSVNLCTSADGKGYIRNYFIPSASFNITSSLLDSQYIYAAYNNGSPIYNITTNRNSVDNIQTTQVYTITVGANNSLSYVGWDAPGVLLANKLFDRTVNVHGIERESGLVLGESGSRYITVTSGAAWQGVQKLNLPAVNSSTNRFVLVSHSGSNAFSGSLITQYNNTQYDDGTGLQSLTGNRFTVNWVYRAIGNLNSTVVMLGNQYNLYADAHDAQPPTPPSELKDIAILVGRAIYQENNATATIIESAFNETFEPAGITDHNLLNNLQGGTTNQYYHLTSAEYGNTSSGSFIRQTGSFISGSITNATSASYALTSSYSYSSSVATTSSYATVSNRVNYKITTLSSNTTLDPVNHYTVLIDASSGIKTISLPSTSSNNGTLFNIKKIDSTGNNVIVNSVDVAPIDGNSSVTIQNRYTTLTVQCSGSNWWII